MHGLKSLFIALSKAIGTKAAIAVTTVSVAASAGAVGTAGYVAVHQIQQRNQQIIQQAEETEQQNQNGTGQKAASTDGQNPDAGQIVSDLGNALPNNDPDYNQNNNQNNDQDDGQDSEGDISATPKPEHIQQETQSPKESKTKLRQQRLKSAAAAVQPTTAEYQALLAIINAQLTMQPPAVTPIPTVTPTASTTPTEPTTPTSPAEPATPAPIPTEAPNPPAEHTFINAKANYITPYVFYGENQSEGFTENTNVYSSIFTEEVPTKKYTIMLYFCGTDLETDGGAVTYDLTRIITEYGYSDLNDVNILLCAGGTTEWKNTYMSTEGDDGCDNDNLKCNLYYIDPIAYNEATMKDNAVNASTCKLLGSHTAIDMGDAKLLAGFMDYSAEKFPAENYGMIMWNHGGGINNGVCFSANYKDENTNIKGTSITSDELESALASTKLFREENRKLAFIGYDACLMGGIEQSYMVSPYVDYSIGSSEVSVGDWDYQNVINCVAGRAQSGDNEAIAKQFVKDYYEEHNGGEIIASTACFDSQKIKASVDEINALSESISNLYRNEDMQADIFQALKQARIHTSSLGAGKDRPQSGFNEAIDLYEFLDNLSVQFEKLKTKETYQNNSEICTQFNGICSQIQTVYNQYYNYVLASGIKFNKKKISENGAFITDNQEYWTAMKNNAFMGAVSIYVPYFTPYTQQYYDNKVMKEYAALMELYVDDLMAENAEGARVQRLASAIDYAKLFQNQTESTTESVGFEPVKMEVAAGSKYLNMKLKESYDTVDQPTDETTPFTDLMDTVDQITVYVSRYQAPASGSGNGLDIVYGSKGVDLSAIANAKEEINIPKENLTNIFGYMVQAYNLVKWEAQEDKSTPGSAYVYDWATLSDLEKDEYSKKENLESLGDVYQNNPSLSWLSFKGNIGKRVTEQDVQSTNANYDYSDALLYFCNSAENKDEYKFAGATFSTTEETKALADLTSEDMGYSVIQFYHYIVDNGALTKVDGSAFSAPVLAIDNTMCIYKKNLTEGDETKYNDYTIGFTTIKGTDDKSQTYIAPTGSAHENDEAYTGNTQQIDTAVDIGNQGAANNQLNEIQEGVPRTVTGETMVEDQTSGLITTGQEITAMPEITAENIEQTAPEPVTEPILETAAIEADTISDTNAVPGTDTILDVNTAPDTAASDANVIPTQDADSTQEPSSEQSNVPAPVEAILAAPVTGETEEDAL
ncbi:MAG: clostripain-related cysteine peptidase [bacterium]|nr:clostripain-related cysteine peptidase [bacterium]